MATCCVMLTERQDQLLSGPWQKMLCAVEKKLLREVREEIFGGFTQQSSGLLTSSKS